jgi:membrane protease YdiL (CAAX protease family)
MSAMRRAWVVCMIVLTPALLCAQSDRDRVIANDYLRTNLSANLPWLSVGLHFGAAALLSSDGEYSVSDHLMSTSILELSSAPIYVHDPLNAWYGTVATSTLLAAEHYAADRFGVGGHLANYLHWTRVSLAEYRSYESYARTRLEAPAYADGGFARHRLVDLYAAPVNPRVLRDPLVLGYAAANALCVFGSQAIMSGGFPQAVWKTDECYVGDENVRAGRYALANALYFATYYFSGAVGEESYFRGYLFEEISHHTNPCIAALVDSTIFALQHVITDIIRGRDPRFTLFHGLETALFTLALDHLYVRGGLEASVASHAWSNILCTALVAPGFGGVPASMRTFPGWGL